MIMVERSTAAHDDVEQDNAAKRMKWTRSSADGERDKTEYDKLTRFAFTDLSLRRLNVKKRLEEINKVRAKNGLTTKLSQVQLWDEGCKGLSLLISSDGTKTFRATFKLNGKWITCKLGHFGTMVRSADPKKADVQISEARRLTSDYRASGLQGIDPRKQQAQQATSALTYGAVVDQFIEQYATPRQRTWDQTERTLKNNCKDWLDKPIAEITEEDTQALIDKFITEGNGPKAQVTLRWLNVLWKWAGKRKPKHITDPRMMELVDCEFKKGKRDRVYTDDEIKAIWKAADEIDPVERAYMKLLVLLAPRKTALALMRYSDLRDHDNAGNPTLWVTPFELTKSRATANERTYKTPLPTLAQRVLKGLPKSGDRVFPTLPVFYTKADRPVLDGKHLRQQLERHGAPKKFNFHAMRHTVATWLETKGHSDWEIGLCLNHAKSGSVTSGYMHSMSLNLKRDLLTKWADHVAEIVQPSGTALMR
jgi:integrase